MLVSNINVFDMLGNLNYMVCVTTNGIVKSNGELVMGAGVAKEFSNRFPSLKSYFGNHVKENGNTACANVDLDNTVICSLPTKHHYNDKSDLNLIIRSAKEIVEIAEFFGLEKVFIPSPGTGLGGLDKAMVYNAISKILISDKYVICDFDHKGDTYEYINKSNNKEEVEMSELNHEVRSIIYNNSLSPKIDAEELVKNIEVNKVKSNLQAEVELLKSLNKKNAKDMKKWYRQYGMNLCKEETTWKHLEVWFTRNIIVKPVIHDIPLDCRGDEHIRKIIERKIQEEIQRKENNKSVCNNAVLDDLVREELDRLDKEIAESHVLNPDNNKHVKMFRRGQVQCFDMLKLSINNFKAIENDTDLYVDINTAIKITGTESNATFKFSDNNKLTDLFIADLNYDKDDKAKCELAEAFIKRGIVVCDPSTGYMRRFRCFLITPSQSRSSNIWICPEERLIDYRRALCNGVEFEGKMIDVHKLETRIALGASNGYILGKRDAFGNITHYYDYKFIVVPDKKRLITKDLIQPSEKKDEVNGFDQYTVTGVKELYYSEAKELYEQYLNGELDKDSELFEEKVKPFIKESTDGFGLIDVRLCAHWAYELGVINRIEMNYFIEHFKGFNKEEMQKDQSLWLIYNKIPSSYQIRYQFYKGLLVVADLESKGIDVPIVFTKGMEKREEAPISSGAWRICGYNKKKSKYATLTTQSVEALGLSFELQKRMAKTSIAFLTEAVKSVEGVMELCSIKEEHEDNNSIESQLMQILSANPKAFISEYVQKLIIKLVEKQLFGLCRGKFIIHGAYYYMINDPRQILGEDSETLKSGEFYLNGLTKEVALVRYPCVNMLEPQKVKLVECDDLWYLKDLMIFNPYDGTWCAMGGADFDGDICLVIFDDYLVKLVKTRGFITDIVTHKRSDEESKCINNYDNRLEVYLRLHKGSEVGNYSKLHSRTISRIHHDCNYKGITPFSEVEHLEKSVLWTFIIGKEIDKAKTYENFVVPQHLEEYAKFYPVHLKVDTFVRDGQYNESLLGEGGKQPFHSKCPRGMLFKWLQDEYGFFRLNSDVVLNKILDTEGRSDEKKFLDMISNHVSLYKIEEIQEDMKLLYNNYVAFNQNMVEKYKNVKMDEATTKAKSQEYKAKYQYLSEQFEIVCKSNGYNEKTAAYVLAKIPYDIDQNNIGRVYPVENEYGVIEMRKNTNKRSKGCAFHLAEKYMLDLIRTAKDNTIRIELPDDVLDGSEVVVNNNILTVNGISYLFDKLVDGIYTAITNNRCSYIVANRDQLKLKSLSTDDRLDEQSSATMTLAQYKAKVMDIKTKYQFPFTMCKAEYFDNTPKEALEKMAGKEFIVDTVVVGGCSYPIISVVNNDGDYEPVCCLLKCSRSLVGRVFYVQDNILELVDLRTNKGKVAKSVLFNAIEVGEDEELVLDDTIVYNCSFDITDKVEDNEADYSEYEEDLDMEYEEHEEDLDIDCDDEYDEVNCIEYEEHEEDLL